MVAIDERGVRSHTFAAAEPKGCLFEYVYLARPGHRHRRPQRAGGEGRGRQAAGGRVSGRRRPGHPGAGVQHAGGDRIRAGQRHPLRPGTGQELLRRPDVHPAEPDHQGARHPAEVQPAARCDRRPAAGRGRRLDRPRQHPARDRGHAARGRGGGGARPDLQPAGGLAVLLRHRLRQPGRADGGQPDDRGDQAVDRR